MMRCVLISLPDSKLMLSSSLVEGEGLLDCGNGVCDHPGCNNFESTVLLPMEEGGAWSLWWYRVNRGTAHCTGHPLANTNVEWPFV